MRFVLPLFISLTLFGLVIGQAPARKNDGPEKKIAELPGKTERPHLILSLRLQGDHVFASSTEGLYRARLDKKQWQQIQGESVPEPGGLFVAGRPEEKTLFYFVTRQARRRAAFSVDADANNVKDPQRSGLYRSADLGDSWKLINNAHDFEAMVLLPGGRLFALAVVEKDKERRQIVLMSENGGGDWKDITNGIASGNPMLFLIRDPDHAQRVCLYSAYKKHDGGTVLQAADDTFRWKSVHRCLRSAHREWPPDEKKTQEEFFYHWYYYGYYLRWPVGAVVRLPEEFPGMTLEKESGGIGTCGTIGARLDNYFSLPFRTEKGLTGFDILPDKAAYEFGLKQPLIVNIALVAYKDGKPPFLNPRLIDARDAKLFWSLKVSGPGDQKMDLWPTNREDVFAELKGGQKLADVLKKQDAWQFLLTAEKPARRAIDLRDLGMPDKPGTYRVQLLYGPCTWRDDQGITRTLDPVTGQVFTVKIQAR